MAKGSVEKGLADTRGNDDDEVTIIVDPVESGDIQDKGTV